MHRSAVRPQRGGFRHLIPQIRLAAAQHTTAHRTPPWRPSAVVNNVASQTQIPAAPAPAAAAPQSLLFEQRAPVRPLFTELVSHTPVELTASGVLSVGEGDFAVTVESL